MNKLDRFRFGSAHKRKLKVIGITALSVFVVGLGLLAVVGVFGSRSENVRLDLDEQTTGVTMEGVGINLSSIPSSNRLRDFDFESSLTSQSYTISSADSSYLYFESDSDISNQMILSGDSIDVYSIDSTGVMNLRFTGTVDSISESRFGMNNLIVDKQATWFSDPIVDTALSDNVVDAITANGVLISDLAGECSVAADADIKFVDICSSGQNVYALTVDGMIFMSADGRNFSFFKSLEITGEARYIAASSSTLAVLTSSGEYWNISGGRDTCIPVNINPDDSVLVSDGETIVLANGRNILSSSNGYYFSSNSLPIRDLRSMKFISVSQVQGVIALLNDAGQLLVVSEDGGYMLDLLKINPKMVACSTDKAIIVLSEDGNAYLVGYDKPTVNLTAGAGSIDSIYTGASGKVIARSGSNLYMDRVLSGIQIVETVPEQTVMPGDICVISSNVSRVSDNWTTYGDNTLLATTNDKYGRCLVINGKDDDLHAVYQTLKGSTADNFSENSFYRLELKVKGDIDGNLKVWVAGDKMLEGLETEVGENFETVSYVFAVTESMISEEDAVRVNISFEGEGYVYVDDIYLGEDKYTINDIPSSFSESVIEAHPATIRLSGISIGSNGFSEGRFYSLNEDSLENSLRLVRDSGSCPWIVIGSDVKQADINKFLEYLCGSVSTEYGKLRTDNGTALPWNRQFDRIYIEIDDDIGAYVSDVQRGAYASYIIGLFRQSENYIDIRDKIVFIDGMHYDGANVLSNCDYHASPLSVDLTSESMMGASFIQRLRTTYTRFVSESPRVALHMGVGGEYISSLTIKMDDGDFLSAAELASMFLDGDADYIKMCLFNVEISDRPVDTESVSVFSDANSVNLLKMINTLSFIKNTEGMYYTIEDPLSSSSSDTAETFNQSCSTMYVTGRENRYLIVANSSDSQQQFVTEGPNLITDGATIQRYSSGGDMLFNRSVRRTDIRFTLQPGEIIVFTIPNE